MTINVYQLLNGSCIKQFKTKQMQLTTAEMQTHSDIDLMSSNLTSNHSIGNGQ